MNRPSESGGDAEVRWHRLCDHPDEARWWDWYALLRLAQCAAKGSPRIGYGIRLDQDMIRLGQPPFFHTPAFPVASLDLRGPRQRVSGEMEPPTGGDATSLAPSDPYRHPRPWLYSYQMGFFGPFGPLPLHLTELAHSRDRSFAAFCDVLHHRFLSYFFRAWADARKEIALDRGENQDSFPADDEFQSPRPDPWTDGERLWELYLGSLIGLGLRELRGRDRVPDHAKLYYSGRLISPIRNAEGLQAILEDYFEVPTGVIPFFPRRVRIPGEIRCRLGGDGVGRLGLSILVGESYVDRQLGFRIRLGPLNLEEFEDFLPGARGLGALHDWVRFYLGLENDPNLEADLEGTWDLQLVLRAADVPPLELGTGPKLGLTTWLCSNPVEHDVDDLVLRPSADMPPKSTTRDAA